MNETGSYPGQPWLWLYTLWYQVPGFSSSANVDLIAVYMTGLATILLLAVPFIPGLRDDLPRLIPVHRLIWRGRGRRPGSGGAPVRTASPARWARPPPGRPRHEDEDGVSGPGSSPRPRLVTLAVVYTGSCRAAPPRDQRPGRRGRRPLGDTARISQAGYRAQRLATTLACRAGR